MNKLLFVALAALICSSAFAVAPANCKTESAVTAGNCADCNDGYGIGSPATSCVKCTPTNCNDCSSDGLTCTECASGYGLVDGSPTASQKACSACTVTKCATCPTAPGTCTGCSAGYYLKDAKCVACTDSNCAVCGTTGTCNDCNDGYALADDNTCTACENGCKTCDEADDSCSACPTGRVLNNTNKDAAFCCAVNCSGCTSATFCTACVDGSNLNKDKGTCFGFKTGASLTLGAMISVALFSLLF